jgi:hypothetical protein
MLKLSIFLVLIRLYSRIFLIPLRLKLSSLVLEFICFARDTLIPSCRYTILHFNSWEASALILTHPFGVHMSLNIWSRQILLSSTTLWVSCWKKDRPRNMSMTKILFNQVTSFLSWDLMVSTQLSCLVLDLMPVTQWWLSVLMDNSTL